MDAPLDSIDTALVAFSLGVTLLFGVLKASARIEASSPPLLIKTLLLFGHPVFTRKIRLDKITWVRDTYDMDSRPCIEGGTEGYQTIPIARIPYSPQHKEEASQLCDEIAEALNIASKGFDKTL